MSEPRLTHHGTSLTDVHPIVGCSCGGREVPKIERIRLYYKGSGLPSLTSSRRVCLDPSRKGSGVKELETVQQWLVEVNEDLCVGTGDCVRIAPQAFVLDPTESTVRLLPAASKADLNALISAVNTCPTQAIRIVSQAGGTLSELGIGRSAEPRKQVPGR